MCTNIEYTLCITVTPKLLNNVGCWGGFGGFSLFFVVVVVGFFLLFLCVWVFFGGC